MTRFGTTLMFLFVSDCVKVAGCWNWKYWLSTVSLLFIFYFCTPSVSDLSLLLLLCCVQMIMLEGAKATTETVDALRSGASAMKAIQKATYASCFCFLSTYEWSVMPVLVFVTCNCTHILSVETVEVQFSHFSQKRGCVCVCVKKLTSCCCALQKYWWCWQDNGWNQWADREYEADPGGSLNPYWRFSWYWWGTFPIPIITLSATCLGMVLRMSQQ